MNKEDRSKWLELFAITIIMTIFSIIALIYMPFIVVLIPAPFIVYGIQTDSRLGILGFFLVCLNIAVLLGGGMGIIYLLLFLPFIAAVNYMIKKQKKFSDILFNGTIIFFISILILGAISSQALDSESIDMDEIVEEAIVIQLDRLESTGLEGKQLEDAADTLREGYARGQELIPFFILAISMGMTFINLKLTSLGLSRLDDYIVNDPKFYTFRLPKDMIRGAIVMFLITSFMSYRELTYSDLFRINISMIIGLLMIIQGFAVLSFILNKRGINRILKFILYATTIVIVPALGVIYILGLLDVFLDFRKLEAGKK